MEDIVIRRQTRWYTHVGDFLNTLKAFIGINYQAVPFSFAASGLAVGVVGLLLVATLTGHCCQLLIRCKTFLIEKICREDLASGKIGPGEVESLRDRLHLTIGYGDVGRLVFGDWCYLLIQVVVGLTQFIICLIYFVFIANTVSMIFPFHQVLNQTHHPNGSVNEHHHYSGLGVSRLFPSHTWMEKPSGMGFPYNTSGYNSSTTSSSTLRQEIYDESSQKVTSLVQSFSTERTFSEAHLSSTAASSNETDHSSVTTAPDLRLLVLFPLPIFLFTSLIRNVRFIAPFSTIATGALILGAVSVLAFLIHGFTITSFHWYKILTLPFFFCSMIAAYEGIGCILPIHSSMVGCRHLLSGYIQGSVYLIFVVLCTFGVLGYLRYGDDVQQILVMEIEQHTILSILVDVTLIVSVLFTYPLQCFPVLEVVENLLFGSGTCCKSSGTSVKRNETERPAEDLEREPLINSDSTEKEALPTATKTMTTVAKWKRNLLRLVVTLIIAGMAVLLRNYFAYLGSFSGAIGSVLLAFIFPCLFDLRLRHQEMSRLEIFKNVAIILGSVVASVLGLIVTVADIVKGR